MKQIHLFFTFLLDIIFPKTPLVRTIEKMSPYDLFISAQKNIETTAIRSIFRYKDPYIQAGVWELKYRKNGLIAKLFATLLYECILEDADTIPPSSLIMPIPLSKERLKERGYNQCELLIDTMPTMYTKNTTCLIRVTHTFPQTKLKRSTRTKNMKNCFAVINRGSIAGKTIILIDDVTTTGSTLLEAQKTLLQAGAKEVKMYTIAC